MSAPTHVTDWGHVVVVTVDGYGAHDAMGRAERHLTGDAGFVTATARRARIVIESPDPADWPSTFEVMVTVTP